MGKEKSTLAEKINVLRAAVMGANDGIISVAGIVLGVAGASISKWGILISGLAGMLAGSISMAMGEYVSVHSQRDAQIAAVAREQHALDTDFSGQEQFLKDKLLQTGISSHLAEAAVAEMLAKTPLKTIVREKYGFDLEKKISAYAAALASMIAFPTGAALPLLAILIIPTTYRIIGTMVAVVIALILTGYFAAVLSHSSKLHGTIRNVVSGMLTMFVTYFLGRMF